MSLESALLAALSAVVSALVYVARLLWQRSEACEQDRIKIRLESKKELDQLRTDVATLREVVGHSKGILEVYKKCPRQDCPFL